MPRSDATPSVDRSPDPEVAVRFRPMEEADLPQVLEIERGFSAPWSREMFIQELHQIDIAANRVAVVGSNVLGYVLWWYVADEIHIVNVAVHVDFRRRGIARRLLAAAFEAASERDMHIATLEVRARNQPAQALYEALGFRKIAIRKGYYADNGEDAIVMLMAL
jgi:[ribosomal protein S18]-alanine N-acetyltransferase